MKYQQYYDALLVRVLFQVNENARRISARAENLALGWGRVGVVRVDALS